MYRVFRSTMANCIGYKREDFLVRYIEWIWMGIIGKAYKPWMTSVGWHLALQYIEAMYIPP